MFAYSENLGRCQNATHLGSPTMKKALAGFKEFISRGSVVELAVAVVIGAAFSAVITAFVAGMLTPLIALIFGKPSFSALVLTISGTQFLYGSFLTEVINFLIIAATIYFFVIVPLNRMQEKRATGEPPSGRDCPECLSSVPIAARRCSHCTTPLIPQA